MIVRTSGSIGAPSAKPKLAVPSSASKIPANQSWDAPPPYTIYVFSEGGMDYVAGNAANSFYRNRLMDVLTDGMMHIYQSTTANRDKIEQDIKARWPTPLACLKEVYKLTYKGDLPSFAEQSPVTFLSTQFRYYRFGQFVAAALGYIPSPP